MIASGLLCGVLALIAAFTDRAAFFSPLAAVVVAAVGAVAVMLQLRLLQPRPGHAWCTRRVWLNLLGIAFALVALFADHLSITPQLGQLMALGAVGSFAISSAVILHAFRRDRVASKE